MILSIRVLQKHISKGARFSPRECPLALAFQDSGFPAAVVGGIAVCLNPEANRYSVLPAQARAFIADFDEDIVPVFPFSFPVEV